MLHSTQLVRKAGEV